MAIARLHIELADIEPKVVRVMEVPTSIRLDRLHFAIQAAMPWENSHLYQFEAGDARWEMPDPDLDLSQEWSRNTHSVVKATLADLIKTTDTANATGPTAIYRYDFGDDWRHTLTIEATIEPEPGHLYPRLIEIEGRCPPEDIGGVSGYDNFLEAVVDPNHPRHTELLDCHGKPFGPNAPPVDKLRLAVLKLGKKWQRMTEASVVTIAIF